MIVALSGGIGGAKLALGLSRVLPPGELTIIANVGDDFEHLGMSISPDIDTLTYTLAGLDNPELGWGRRDETWAFMETLGAFGGATWFRLGDRDLALHALRTQRLRAGERLSDVTADIARRLGIASRILPATDDRLRTELLTEEGWMEFQPWFVGRRAGPAVQALRFAGAEQARPAPGVVEAVRDADAIVLCPSNPFISIDPILAVPGLRTLLRDVRRKAIAVTPIIGGSAVKGPTAKMMAELGLSASARTVAERYADIIGAFVADERDAGSLEGLPCNVFFAQTLMETLADKQMLARTVLRVAEVL